MKRDARSPSHYIESIDDEKLKALLLQVREVIFELKPETDEIIEYGMLGYPRLANLAAQKHFVCLYVLPKALAAYKEQYPETNCGKSCLRFGSAKAFNREAVKELLEQIIEIRKAE